MLKLTYRSTVKLPDTINVKIKAQCYGGMLGTSMSADLQNWEQERKQGSAG